MAMNLTEYENWCAEQVTAGRAPSLSVAAAVDGEIAFASAFGYADAKRGQPATADTPYLLASITKPIAATAVCHLADDGRIDLDDPIEHVLTGPRFTRHRGQGEPTIRQVLQHTSGLGTHYEFFYADTDGPCGTIAERIERYGVLYNEPGARWCYSNLGYGILDEVVRQVSGRSPEQYAHDEVFAPLGMETAWIGPSYGKDLYAAAQRYTPSGDALPAYDMCHRGASAAWMSAADLVRFGLSQAGGPTVLSPQMQTETIRSTVPSSPTSRYGLGWSTWRIGEHDIIGHGGGMPGVSTRFLVIPEIKLVAVVLVNQSARGFPAIADEVLDRLLSEVAPSAVPSRKAPELRPVTAGLEGTWVGSVATYSGAVPFEITFRPGGAVSATLAGSEADALPTAAGAFYSPADVLLEFLLQLPTPEARVRSPQLRLNLFLDGDQLVGSATACPDPDAADGREGNGYSHWCELDPS